MTTASTSAAAAGCPMPVADLCCNDRLVLFGRTVQVLAVETLAGWPRTRLLTVRPVAPYGMPVSTLVPADWLLTVVSAYRSVDLPCLLCLRYRLVRVDVARERLPHRVFCGPCRGATGPLPLSEP